MDSQEYKKPRSGYDDSRSFDLDRTEAPFDDDFGTYSRDTLDGERFLRFNSSMHR